MNSTGIDWTGKKYGKSPDISSKVPVIPKKSKIYCDLLIALRQVEISLKPAREEEILILLARLRLHYAAGYSTAEEIKLMLKDYLEDLKQFPKDLIEKACIEYRRDEDSKFFPKIGQLIKLINEHWYPRNGKLTKLRKLLEVSNQASEEVEKQQK